jgi:hypothetical protein
MNHHGTTSIRRDWSRRLFLTGTGASLAAGAVGGAFLPRAVAAEGSAGDATAVQGGRKVPDGLMQARELLRQEQSEHPTPRGLAQLRSGESVVATTLAYLDQRRKFEPAGVPGRVKRSGLTFEREIEERRIALAEDLVRRTDPGPFEDPNYLALLAYQAASIELALPDSADGRKIDWGWDRFLLGTVHYRELNAYSRTILSPQNYTIVVLYSGLIEFAYQAAKAVIAALHPVQSTVPGRSVSAEASDQHVADELSHNKEPSERLYRTLEAYFFTTGYPRALHDESVPAEQVIPLNLLIDMAERWIIAHEYGHGFAARTAFAPKAASATESSAQAEEYFADDNGLVLTVLSSARLDHVGPVFSLAGPAFALACLEVLRRSVSVIRQGRVLPDEGDKDHPPNKARFDNILNAFDFHFDVLQDDQAGLDLALVHRPPDWTPADSETRRDRRAAVMQWSNTLFTIWNQARPLLQKDHDSQRTLHAIWR